MQFEIFSNELILSLQILNPAFIVSQLQVILNTAREVVISHLEIKVIYYSLPCKTVQKQECTKKNILCHRVFEIHISCQC